LEISALGSLRSPKTIRGQARLGARGGEALGDRHAQILDRRIIRMQVLGLDPLVLGVDAEPW